MIERVSYLARRVGEAGLGPSAAKLGQKAKPFLYQPLYAAGGWPDVRQSERDAFAAFGAMIAEAFRTAHRNDPKRASRVRERLALAQAPDFPVLGYGALPKPKGEGWHTDPLHGHAWPPRYFAHVDFVATDVRADVKIPWELSRLQWLVWMGDAAVQAEDVEAARITAHLIATLEDWAEANPPGIGVNWTCGMEVAIRAANIAVAAGSIAHRLEPRTLGRIAAFLRAHLDYLTRFPEISDVPGNHYLTDLMGEVVLSAALGGMPSEAFESKLARFTDAADAQFEPGGCHIERATVYHRLTFDIVALPLALAQLAGSPHAPRLKSVFTRAGAFMAQIADDAGTLPVFGDQDSGFVLWFGEPAQAVDRRICRAPRAQQSDLHTFLDALSGGAEYFPETSRNPGKRSFFATIAGAHWRATLKTGPLGLEGRAAHDHDDALSVVASHEARSVLIDPGCHSYTLDPAMRRAFIISSSHNAPVPTTRERHEPGAGSINATMRGAPTAELTQWREACADGRIERTSQSRMDLQRRVRIDEGALQIADTWLFEELESAQITWLFAPEWQLEAEPEGQPDRLILRCDDAVIYAQIDAPAGSTITRERLRFSPDYGALESCWGIRITTPASLDGSAKLTMKAPT